MAYIRIMCASIHVLFQVRKFLLCAIAFAPGKLRVVLKIADQSHAGSHFNSQNTHSQFRNSQLAFYPSPRFRQISMYIGAVVPLCVLYGPKQLGLRLWRAPSWLNKNADSMNHGLKYTTNVQRIGKFSVTIILAVDQRSIAYPHENC